MLITRFADNFFKLLIISIRVVRQIRIKQGRDIDFRKLVWKVVYRHGGCPGMRE